MNILKIVIIESDEEFHLKMHQKFTKELNGNADIVEITNVEYFIDSREEIGDINILLISENMFEQIKDCKLGKYVFVLTTERKSISRDDGCFNIMKYSSPAEIFNIVMRVADINSHVSNHTNAIMFYSPLGNSGKTGLALTVSKIMASSRLLKVLYINMESICSMQLYLSEVELSDDNLDSAIRSGDSKALDVIRNNICTVNYFSYLKPFNDSGAAMDISAEDYAFLVRIIKQTNEFDHIILDMSSDISYRMASIMGECDKVLIITEQDEYSAFKLDKFLSVVRPDKRFAFVCNKFDGSKPNYLKSFQMKGDCRFSTDIPLLDIRRSLELISVMSSERAVKGLANLFM